MGVQHVGNPAAESGVSTPTKKCGRDGLPSLRDNTAGDFLRLLTRDQLLAGIKRGEKQLLVLDALEACEDFQGDGPERLSKAYERYVARDTAERRRLLSLGLRDIRGELARRAAFDGALAPLAPVDDAHGLNTNGGAK